MQVEDVARERLAAGGTAKEKGHLAVSGRLLREIVIDDQRMHAVVPEILAHGAAGIGGKELQRRALRGGRSDHDRILHRTGVFQDLHHLGDRGALLADRDVDAVELLALVVALVDRLLVDEGIDGDRGLAGLAVTDDQLALAAPDRDQAVDRLETGLHRLVHGLPRDDAGSLHLDQLALGRLDRPLAVERIAERVDHAAEQPLAHRHVHDRLGALDRVAFLDVTVVAENHDADIVGLEVQRHAAGAVVELDHLAGLNLVQAIGAGDAVTDGQHAADLGDLGFGSKVRNLLFQNVRNLGSTNVHQAAPFIASSSWCSFVFNDASIMREPTRTTSPPISEGSTRCVMVTVLPTDFEIFS